jgi:hypothetical protein
LRKSVIENLFNDDAAKICERMVRLIKMPGDESACVGVNVGAM